MSASERKAFVEGAEWACGDRAHPQADREANDLYPDSPCKNVKQIAEKYCDDEGYHGLFNEREGCECSIGKSLSGEPPWVCCECVNGDCRPGVLKDGKIVERE
jgi:hypothetical protein